MVLVTGQAGAGKSTTLVALVEELNRSSARHIITLEDPIEFEYVPRRSLIHQREVGQHVASFAEGLRAALRESPDVILVGEMRDGDTMAAALTAAETGHLVLSTLHAASAEMALDRIIDSFPEGQQRQVRVQLASVLRAVFTQFLLPSTAPPARVPAYELLVMNSAVAAMIREDKCHQIPSQIQTGREGGMIHLDRVLARLLQERRIELASARAIAREPERLGQGG
jgi:twitching motility protein PilT